MSGAAPVGQFPDPFRRVIRMPVNPLDVSTIVSIYPVEIDEVKPTIQPGRFIIPPGTLDKPSTLIVYPSSWWRDMDEDQPLLEFPVWSIAVAESIVKDYCGGILGADTVARPGIFYVPGKLTPEEIKKQFPHELEAANQKQRLYYGNLIKLADSLWARSNGNPLAISDGMRLAAREMGQGTREWMKNQQMMETARCKACGGLRNPEYPICPNCKNIDMSHPGAKDLKFATQ
jgi:hypothetical protein